MGILWRVFLFWKPKGNDMRNNEHSAEAMVLDARDIARALKISVPLVRVLLARGEIPAFKIGDRRTFVRREALERYLARREATAA
jgi:excisionase family DNA binding protein